MGREKTNIEKPSKKKPMLSVKARIHDALFEVLNNKHFDNISVREICLTAGLSRQSFYTIFSSKEDVVRSYYLVFLSDLHKNMENFEGDFHARTMKIVESLANDKKLLLLHKYLSLQGLLALSLKEHLDLMYIRHGLELTDERIMLHSIAASLCSNLLYNISTGLFKISNVDVVSFYENFISNSAIQELLVYG